MIRFIIIPILLVCSSAFSQFRYQVVSKPDSALVYISDELRCATPCRISYRFNKNEEIRISVKKEGWKTYTENIDTKPMRFDKIRDISLQRAYPELPIDSLSGIIAFDKLVVNFKNDLKVGEIHAADNETRDINWEGTIKVGEDAFTESFYDIVSRSGFRTSLANESSLFTGHTGVKPALPRFIIGAEIIDFQTEIWEGQKEHYGAGSTTGLIKMVIDWHVFDKSTNQIILRHTSTGKSHYRKGFLKSTGDNLIAFENSLLDFIQKSDLVDAVNSMKSGMAGIEDSQSTTNDKEILSIEESQNPMFDNLSAMVKHASLACVTISTDAGHGSGVLINEDGLVLSALHVVDGVNRIDIGFSNGLRLNARILRYDQTHDVVLLKVEGNGFPYLPLASGSEPFLGEELVTIGTPAEVDLGQSIAKGILSGRRKIEDITHMQIDISVSPGNSGGPLLNMQGDIVGIVQRKMIGEGIEGIGFGLPIQKVLDALSITVN